ncbi:hypothetical protein, partial [Pseudomonas sp. UBA1879]|uniref:hypothetical protein n=1 Tax=Pseudomonas sp. UBA1879 TaxID=1947305 RepID=UPI0025CD41A4
LKSDSGSAQPNLILDAAPEIKVTANELHEGKADASTVAGKLTYSDSDTPADQLKVTLTNGSDKYYDISGNEVLLTQAGLHAVHAGTKLPPYEGNISDGLKSDSDSAQPKLLHHEALA